MMKVHCTVFRGKEKFGSVTLTISEAGVIYGDLKNLIVEKLSALKEEVHLGDLFLTDKSCLPLGEALDECDEIAHTGVLRVMWSLPGPLHAPNIPNLPPSLNSPFLVLSVFQPSQNFFELKYPLTATIRDVCEMIREGSADKLCFPQIYTNEMIFCLVDDILDRPFALLQTNTIFVDYVPNSLKGNRYETHDDANPLHVFADSPDWHPPVSQSARSQSTFLCCLFALTRLSMKIDGFSSYFYGRLYDVIPFSPAALALSHLENGVGLHVEKHVVATSFYYWLRFRLPLSVKDEDVFIYFPYLMIELLTEFDMSTTPEESFTTYSIFDESITDPVFIKSDAHQGRLYERKMVSDDDFQRNIFGKIIPSLESVTFSPPFPFLSLLQLKNKNLLARITGIEPGYRVTSIFKNPQKKSPTLWAESEFETMGKLLAEDPRLRLFSFCPISDYFPREVNLSLLTTGEVVLVQSVYKADSNVFRVFNPLRVTETEDVKSFMSKKNMSDLKLPLCGNFTPVVEEVTVVCLDLSGSMSSPGFPNDKVHSSLTGRDAAKAYFGVLRDKMSSSGVAHALGLILFDGNVEVALPITVALKQIEKVSFGGHGGLTSLYDAIDKAIDLLLEYQKKSSSKSLKLRILCLTDGEDNASKVDAMGVTKKLLKNDVILDVVPVENVSRKLMRMSIASGGIAAIVKMYQDGLDLFEREAMVNVGSRRKCAVTNVKDVEALEKLELKPPCLDVVKPDLFMKAKELSAQKPPPNPPDHQRTPHAATLRRLIKEFKSLQSEPLDGCTIFISENDFMIWKIVMEGPFGSDYANGHFLLFVKFPEEFPRKPPVVRFETPIYHCNINNDGKVCHPILGTNWSIMTTIRSILEYIVDLLRNPNPGDALDSNKAMIYNEDQKKYSKECQKWVKDHASANLEELKKKYKLED